MINALGERDRWTDTIIPMGEFEEIVHKVLDLEDQVSNDDISTLLTYLSREKKMIVYNEMVSRVKTNQYVRSLRSFQLVKVQLHGEREHKITDQDINIASLKYLINSLAKQTELLTIKIDNLTRDAECAVAVQNRIAALGYLRSKRLHESVLTRRSETLAQLKGVYNKIEEAVDQAEAIKAMQSSTGVLRDLNAKAGGVDEVDKVLDELRIEMAKTDEIGTLIREDGSAAQTVDDGETEEELGTLVVADRTAKEDMASLETEQRLGVTQPLPSLEHLNFEPNASLLSTALDQGLGDNIEALNRMSLDNESISCQTTELGF